MATRLRKSAARWGSRVAEGTAPLAIFIGPALAGKTTVAHLLAKRTGTEMLDSDDEIVRQANSTIPEIFADHGESVFRELEADTIAAAITNHSGILALGGGAIVNERTRNLLADYASKGGTVVLLDISAAEASRRLSSPTATGRPLLADEDKAASLTKWRSLKKERQAWYDELATIKIDTGRRWPGQIVNLIDRQLSTRAAS